jgi:hypothetical protein
MDKGISIYFSPEDLAELQEFVVWKTKQAAGNFVSIDSGSDFNLRDAAGLIRRAQQEKQEILRRIDSQRGTEEAMAQQRENVSLLPDREAERIQSEWREQSKLQAQSYADSVNRGATPRAFDPNDKEQRDIRDGVISWLKKQKMRGSFGGRKTLDKN